MMDRLLLIRIACYSWIESTYPSSQLSFSLMLID
jgi:hypothetical protein